MNRPVTVFFDVDDTLYDRGLPFISAARSFLEYGDTDLRSAYRACSARGNEVFLPSQRGEISMEEMYIYRWTKGFGDVGISITADQALEFQKLYRGMQNHIALSPAAEEMLSFCRENARGTGVITNGPSEKQWAKVRSLGLTRYMDSDMIIISGDVGTDKPDPAIFRLAGNRSASSPGDLVFVGDSLSNDIIPAATLGWHTVWFRRDDEELPRGLHPDAIAGTEEELKAAVKQLIQNQTPEEMTN